MIDETIFDLRFPNRKSSIENHKASGQLVFNPGEISKTISVQVCSDRDKELTDAFCTPLLMPTFSTQAVATILNDDH